MLVAQCDWVAVLQPYALSVFGGHDDVVAIGADDRVLFGKHDVVKLLASPRGQQEASLSHLFFGKEDRGEMAMRGVEPKGEDQPIGAQRREL